MPPDFEKAQNEATKLLLMQNFNSLFVDIREFKFDRSIKIDSIQNYCAITGRAVDEFLCEESNDCCVLKLSSGQHLILYNNDEPNEKRKHWGIVHEVAHIYLNHSCDGNKEEVEAHYFAAQIVAPEIVLIYIHQKIGNLVSYDLTDNFNVSLAASNAG